MKDLTYISGPLLRHKIPSISVESLNPSSLWFPSIPRDAPYSMAPEFACRTLPIPGDLLYPTRTLLSLRNQPFDPTGPSISHGTHPIPRDEHYPSGVLCITGSHLSLESLYLYHMGPLRSLGTSSIHTGPQVFLRIPLIPRDRLYSTDIDHCYRLLLYVARESYWLLVLRDVIDRCQMIVLFLGRESCWSF